MKPALPAAPRVNATVPLGASGLWLLLSLLSAPEVRADITTTVGAQSLGTTVNGGTSCSSGSCTIGGGVSRGGNLFQRLNTFRTNGGISDVLIENAPSHRMVVIGVIGRDRTQISVPVTLQHSGGLLLMSPAGIDIQGGGQFLNVQQLGLTTQTGLLLGNALFDVRNTTAQELTAPAYASPISLTRSSLQTNTGTLASSGLTTSGSIAIASNAGLTVSPTDGVELVLEPGLLIDSGQADLSITASRLSAGNAQTAPGAASLALYGNAISLENSELEAAPGGLLNLQADNALNLTNTRLAGLKIGLQGDAITIVDSTLNAARGLIRVEADRRITVSGSVISVAPQTAADVLGTGLDYELALGGGVVTSSTPALIRLSTATSTAPTDGIAISTSSFNASSLVNSIQTNEGTTAADQSNQFLNAGNILISSRGQLVIQSSQFDANADRDFAGMIQLSSADPSGILNLTNSALHATAANGSGDILIYGEGGISIQGGSHLDTSTAGLDYNSLVFKPGGEIRIISAGDAGVAISDSVLLSRYDITADPELRYPFGSSDSLDPDDNNRIYDPIPLGGLIQVSSAGGIQLANSSLDVGSSTGVSGRQEFHAFGNAGITIQDSQLLASTSGSLPVEIESLFGVPPEPLEGLQAGSITLTSRAGITIGSATAGGTVLDVSNQGVSARYDTALAGFVPLVGTINLLSEGANNAGILVDNTALLGSSPFTAGADPVTGYDLSSQGASVQMSLAEGSGQIRLLNTTTDLQADQEGQLQLLDPTQQSAALWTNRTGESLDSISLKTLAKSGTTPNALQSIESYVAALDRLGVDLIIQVDGLNNVTVTAIATSLGINQPAIASTVTSFDLTSELGLQAFRAFLLEQGRSTEEVSSITRQIQLSLGDLRPTAALSLSRQSDAGLLSAAIGNLTPLTTAEAMDSLAAGEQRSRDQLAEFLGSTDAPPQPPSLTTLQEVLRRSARRLPSGETKQSAILRLSYAPSSGSDGTEPGSLDLVLLTAEDQPMGWRSSIRLSELRALLRRFYSNLAEQNPALHATQPADDSPERLLYDLTLKTPLSQLGKQAIDTLIISADSSLIDIPFNALHNGSTYLGQTLALAVTPSLAFSNLSGAPANPPASQIQRINAGASIFSNGLTSLPMVERELAALSQSNANGVTTTLLNSQFTPARFSDGFTDSAIKQVHIASHAEIAAGAKKIPIIYTSDAEISLRELGKLRQRGGTDNLDLVTLSACRSALNAADLELGFAGLAVQLGARTAIGTKWYVDDLATSSFFVLFYQLLAQGYSKSDALRATQQAFANGTVQVVGTRVTGPGNAVLLEGIPETYAQRYGQGFSHPYYWAGIQLVGSPW